MKKRIVIKLSGQVFGMEHTKKLKDYATFFVKQSKIVVKEVKQINFYTQNENICKSILQELP